MADRTKGRSADAQRTAESVEDVADAPAGKPHEAQDEGYVPKLKPGEVGFTSQPHRPKAPVQAASEPSLRPVGEGESGEQPLAGVPLESRIEKPHVPVEELMRRRQELDRQERATASGGAEPGNPAPSGEPAESEAAARRRGASPNTADTGGVTGSEKRGGGRESDRA